MAIFEISDFDVTYMTRQRPTFQAVKNASLAIEPGEIVGLVGESGSGKSTLGNAAIRLLDPPGTITGGSVVFDGMDITRYNDDQMRPLRWADISTVFQSSMASLNPVINIESQFRDVIQTHTPVSDSAARQRTSELLEMVDIAPSFMRFFPHELSGGMKQRVAIALALALQPKFVLLDEPTTGLDVVVQREILKNLKNIQRTLGFAVLIISHDLGAVMEISDRVVVMYNGELVDNQPTNTLLHANLHPYSRKLLNSYRELWGIEPDQESSGTVASIAAASNDLVTPSPPPLDSATAGEIGSSANAPEARVSVEARANLMHRTGQAGSGQVVLRVSDIVKTYSRRRGFVTSTVAAVRHVSFELERGRILALVGQSGSGKSTIGRLVTGVERPDSGSIVFTENTTPVDIRTLGHKALKDYRRHAQLVFQDPYSALNPAHTVAHSLARPLQNYRKMNGKDARAECRKMLERVGLTPAERFIDKYPHQLSGGQRQRVVVARALAPNPEILIADEPTSMLDVSIRAEILGLLNDLVRDENLAMLYITHDLLSARLLADEIMVLNEGRIVESGSAEQVIEHPQDDYTQLLLRSIPNPFATSDMAAD